jgi:hypothetical protein
LLWLVSLGAALLLGSAGALLGSLVKDNRTLASLAGLVLLPALIPASVILMLLLRIFPSTLFATGAPMFWVIPCRPSCPARPGRLCRPRLRLSGAPADAVRQAGALTGSVSAALLAGFQMLQPSYEGPCSRPIRCL